MRRPNDFVLEEKGRVCAACEAGQTSEMTWMSNILMFIFILGHLCTRSHPDDNYEDTDVGDKSPMSAFYIAGLALAKRNCKVRW